MRLTPVVLFAIAAATAQGQSPAITGVVNNATLNAGPAPIAPGEFVHINGSNLGDTNSVGCRNTDGSLTSSCNGVSVSIGGKAAWLFSEASTVLSIQVPFDLTGTSATVVVTRVAGGQTLISAPFNVTVAPTAPQIFTSQVNGSPFGQCFDSANTPINASHPSVAGSPVVCQGTGFGITNPVVPNGSLVPVSGPTPSVVAAVAVTVGGQNAVVVATTLAAGSVAGQDNVTFVMPRGLNPGPQTIVISAGGVNAQGFSLNYNPVSATDPAVTSVQNPASNIPAALPNGGIAQGSIFVLYGRNLGPTTIVQPTSLPLPDTLGGTQITVTVNGTTVKAFLVYSLNSQLAAVLPSTTPTGTGTINVIVNGTSSQSFPVNVVKSNFGISTVDQTGGNAAVITYPDYSLVSPSKSAKPGDTLIIWGTGLGPIGSSDAVIPTTNVDAGLSIQVWVGGVAATVVYRGRSGAPGLDQINIVVPQGATGCNVSLAVQTGTVLSNYTSMAIAPNGGQCSDPNGLSATTLAGLLTKSSIRGAVFTINQSVSTQGSTPTTTKTATAKVTYFSFTHDQLASQAQSIFKVPALGSCFVVISQGSSGNSDGPSATLLNAGSSVTLTPPSGAAINVALQQTGSFQTTLTSLLPAGNYLAANSGGVDLSATTLNFTVPQTVQWTNQASLANTTIDRSKGVTVTWSGGDSGSYVDLQGGMTIAGPSNGSIKFECGVPVAAGQFTVPPSVLLALPAQGGFLQVGNQTISTFVPGAGLDAVSASGLYETDTTVTYK